MNNISVREAGDKLASIFGYPVAVALLLAVSCRPAIHEPPLFEVRGQEKTGLDFSNRLHPDSALNLFKYMYYYNGAGIGAADFNNDGKTDLFFAANQGPCRLYLNEGNLHFRDVTAEAGITPDSAWNTGVSVVDINHDGLMDIYICRVGNYKSFKGKNSLLVCQGLNKDGVPYYRDEAAAYGLDFSGFSTQAAFFDYDGDGDLDLFLLNHSVNHEGNFAPRAQFLGTYDSLAGDRMYRNDNGHFTDVTRSSGINSSKIGYGLGLVISDLNLDGWPDIYVGNDFHENDYLYINQHDGTFREENSQHLMHTSQFSMGVDAADANNDGYPEIISMDMLPSDPYILKRSLEEDDYDIFYHKINIGYNYQYSRNNLQYNRRNGAFSELGVYAGVYATDWSWAPLFMDFDNDGLKDLFISNGIPKRMNDIDYINFVSSDEIQEKLKGNQMDDKQMDLISKFPEIKIPNKFYLNNGDMTFRDLGGRIGGDLPSFSNGAVYADLDGDGDLDIVVNNINDPALVYENKSNDGQDHPFTEISLQGPALNPRAYGARAVVFANGGIRTYEHFPVRGFLSSMDIPLHIGLYHTRVDSAFLIWPDNSFERIQPDSAHPRLVLQYRPGLPRFDYSRITSYWHSLSRPLEEIAASRHLDYRHEENRFDEFNREPLIPHMLSTEGPALAVGDINKDGLEDIFIGSSKGLKSGLFIQDANGNFSRKSFPDLDIDSTFEDVSACFTDLNNDGRMDLVVASGGNEYYGESSFLLPRVYLGDSTGRLVKKQDAFSNLYVTESCVVPYDFNGDGHMDLFIGGRSIPWAYGKTPPSYLLLNDGTGKFTDVTRQYAPGLADIGMVTSAVWVDLDRDGDQDLVVSLEWGGIVAFLNDHGHFTQKVLTNKKGWWNFILPCDVDHDGNIDLIAGNLGTNARLKASPQQPVHLYYNDFDNNGQKEQVLTYYVGGREIPFFSKLELERQIPSMKKKFLYAEDFARANLNELFSRSKLEESTVLTADYFSSAVLLNHGGLNFEVRPLPWEAQLSPLRDGIVVDANQDGLPDIMLVGNFYENNVEMGRNDADFGTLLINQGQGNFRAEPFNGVTVKGQSRHIRQVKLGKAGEAGFVIARNNDSTLLLRFRH